MRYWRDDPAYERRLADFCLSLIVRHTWAAPGYHSRDAIMSLAYVPDPRALAVLHGLCAFGGDTVACHDLMGAMEDRGDPASIPVLEKIPRADEDPDQYGSGERRRARALEHLRLVRKYGHELRGQSLDREQQTTFMRCLDGPEGIEALVRCLRDWENEAWFLGGYLRSAQYVDREPVRACLREVGDDPRRNDRLRTMARAALARLGDPAAAAHLERALAHPDPGVRLAAAEGPWRLGRRDGFRTLLDLLDLRPLETGGEGVTVGDGTLTVTALRDTNVEVVRSACRVLGEMGDPSAIEPLRRLRAVNLNGTLGGGGSPYGGTGWPGRPDAVPLARLGDFSGVEVLRQSVRDGDRLGVLGSWGGTGDFVAIGLKRFIPELLPVLDSPDPEKRIVAAEAIRILLERGR